MRTASTFRFLNCVRYSMVRYGTTFSKSINKHQFILCVTASTCHNIAYAAASSGNQMALTLLQTCIEHDTILL